jgi:transposase
MEKPIKYQPPTAYKYQDIIDYIEEKYNIKTRGYKEEIDGIYRDFWHWVIDRNSMLNRDGCYISILSEDVDYSSLVKEEDYLNKEDCRDESTWVLEILQMIRKEFPDLEIGDRVWVEW